MERAKSRQKIRENLNSGQLPKDFDVTFFCVGSPRPVKPVRGAVKFSRLQYVMRLLAFNPERDTGFMKIARRCGKKSGITRSLTEGA